MGVTLGRITLVLYSFVPPPPRSEIDDSSTISRMKKIAPTGWNSCLVCDVIDCYCNQLLHTQDSLK